MGITILVEEVMLFKDFGAKERIFKHKWSDSSFIKVNSKSSTQQNKSNNNEVAKHGESSKIIRSQK
ncbi:hypothetical protein C1645_839150 [Glomus cerebriforme]|uniref:Uncharacterized protein n=1 Tax=Glomus cerebriforme TaxID=658196 RepID=A0A397S189_9GLOM|nr:hypothetical protein C1645_839150 [Glomus cerebriforme]